MKQIGRQAQTAAFVLGLFLSCIAPVPAQPPGVSPRERAEKVVVKVRANELTPEKAFGQGLLDKPTLLLIVGDDKLPDPNNSLWNSGPAAHRWTGFLLEKFPEVLTEIDQQEAEVRVRVSLYLCHKNDKRGAEILEKIIAEQPHAQPNSKILLSALYNLSGFYQRNGQFTKAYETALRVKEYNLSPDSQSNILLGAARALSAGGDKEGAMVAYEEVVALGYGWATGHAYVDMARLLFHDGKKEEARALLKTPITGINSDLGMVLTKSSLLNSYYEDGQWEQAREWAQATIDQYENSSKSIRGMESYANSAKSRLEQIQQWQTSPVSLHTRKIEVSLPDPLPAQIYVLLGLYSYRPFTLQATTSDPGIELIPLLSPGGYDSPAYKQFTVKIDSRLLQGNARHQLVLTFAEFPDVKFEIPISARPKASP